MKQRINNIFTPIIQRTISAIFPPLCLSCSTIVSEEGNMCNKCWEKASFITAPMCSKCGVPFELKTFDEMLCGECISDMPKYDKARAVFVYDESSRKLVSRLKYSDKTYVSPYVTMDDACFRWSDR